MNTKRIRYSHMRNTGIILSTTVLLLAYQNCSVGLKAFKSDQVINFASTTQFIEGKSLYDAKCLSCHTAAGDTPQKAGRSSNDILSAIKNIPTMSYLSSLTQNEMTLISIYLNTSSSCAAPNPITRVHTRLLTNAEYDNIVADVLGVGFSASNLAKFDNRSVGKSGFQNDSSAIFTTNLSTEKYWTSAGNIAADVLAKKATTGSGYARIASCALNQTNVTDTCINTVVRNVGRLLWRRPLIEGANSEFLRLKSILTGGANFDDGLSNLLKAALMSPHFLFLSIENPGKSNAANVVFDLNGYQLASRLSFFLWQSTPDDALLEAARTGGLSTPDGRKAQVVRMLKDVKARRFASVLANEWFGLDTLLTVNRLRTSAQLAAAMNQEAIMLIQDIVSNDLSATTLFNAKYTFVNKALADFYGLPFPGADPEAFVKVSLTNNPRQGILGQGGFLVASASSETESHPVTRGKIIGRRVACAEIAPPPPDVGSVDPGSLPPNAIPAEMLAIHVSKPACVSCHKVLDPYGLALETFSPQGVFRTTYENLGGRAVPQSGTLPTGESFANTQEFFQKLATSNAVKSCMAEQLSALALTRAATSALDKCTSKAISQQYIDTNARFSELIAAVVNSSQFAKQVGEAK